MDDLLIKYLLGEATSGEAAEVERWIAADPGNRSVYEQYKALWRVARRTAVDGAEMADPRQAWPKLRTKLRQNGARIKPEGEEDSAEIRIGYRKAGAGTGWLRPAAILIGILLLGAAAYLTLLNRRPVASSAPPPQTATKGSREGGQEFRAAGRWLAGARPRTDTLPDGTLVILNRGASLEVVEGAAEKAAMPATGGAVRNGLTVQLRGEGFFTVVHDPARVFVVRAGAVPITVLGTSFEVREHGDSVEVMVETGAVRAGDSCVVHAGEQLTITGSKHWKRSANRDKLYGYYLGRPLICYNTPLRQLLEAMNRTDDTPIVLGRPELGSLPLTTVFRGEPPGRILEVVAMTFHLSIVRQGSAIILK
jgi:ferric-dicitrate binding protein FerR (iron transport regulator)